MASHDTPRIISCEGIFNLRDYGGYPVAGGGRLRRGLLFRSGQHRDATDADLDNIDALALGTVVDLRGGSERQHSPCRRPVSFTAEVIGTDQETVDPAMAAAAAAAASGEERARPVFAETHEVLDSMRAVYAGMPFRPVLIDLFSRYFKSLAERDSASLIHCMAGKDRTGFAVSLFHHVAGVHVDDAMEDYLATNQAPGREEWIERSLVHAGKMRDTLSPDVIQVMFGVDASYLESAWKAVREECGSVDTYLDKVLGVDAGLRKAIRERFIM